MKVKDEYRTNPMSNSPGGVEVIVHFHNGHIRVYDKVKNPGAFARKVLKNSESLPEKERPSRIETENEVLWEG